MLTIYCQSHAQTIEVEAALVAIQVPHTIAGREISILTIGGMSVETLEAIEDILRRFGLVHSFASV